MAEETGSPRVVVAPAEIDYAESFSVEIPTLETVTAFFETKIRDGVLDDAKDLGDGRGKWAYCLMPVRWKPFAGAFSDTPDRSEGQSARWPLKLIDTASLEARITQTVDGDIECKYETLCLVFGLTDGRTVDVHTGMDGAEVEDAFSYGLCGACLDEGVEAGNAPVAGFWVEDDDGFTAQVCQDHCDFSVEPARKAEAGVGVSAVEL